MLSSIGFGGKSKSRKLEQARLHEEQARLHEEETKREAQRLRNEQQALELQRQEAAAAQQAALTAREAADRERLIAEAEAQRFAKEQVVLRAKLKQEAEALAALREAALKEIETERAEYKVQMESSKGALEQQLQVRQRPFPRESNAARCKVEQGALLLCRRSPHAVVVRGRGNQPAVCDPSSSAG